MSRLRPVLFWLHLVAGLLAGLVIAILCVTGTALAFEKQLIAWSERDARQVAVPPPEAPRLGLDELTARFQAAHPDARANSLVISRDPATAVVVSVSRTESYHVNPYTGEVRRPASTAVARFMHTMVEWHRYLSFSSDPAKPRAKLVTGSATIVFCFLALSGLILWWPRTLSWRALRPSVWFTQNTSARARDWNWHNTIGFWSAPVLIVLTLTALPIAFPWAGKLTYTLTGTPLPASGPQSSGAPPAPASVPAPAAGARAVSRDVLVASAQRELPRWETITLRAGTRPDPAKPQPVSLTVREADTLPRTATTTLQFDPFTGQLLQRDGYAQLSAARQVRAWTRYLHTGEALGWIGQLVAGLATLGGCFLVYTGFALSWRRFFGRN